MKRLTDEELLAAYAVGARWINKVKGYPAWQENRLDRDYFKAWKRSVRALLRRLKVKVTFG